MLTKRLKEGLEGSTACARNGNNVTAKIQGVLEGVLILTAKNKQ